MLQPLWTIGPVLALKFWPGLIDDRWGTYALVTVLLSYPYCRMYWPYLSFSVRSIPNAPQKYNVNQSL